MIDGWRDLWRRASTWSRTSPWSVLVPVGLIAVAVALPLLTKGSAETEGVRSPSVAASRAGATDRSPAPAKGNAKPRAKDEAAKPQAKVDPPARPEAKDDAGESRKKGHAGKAPATDDAFRTATVRSGTKVAVYRSPGGKIVERVGPRTEFGSKQVFSVVARRGGWLRVATALSAHNRDHWIRADPESLRFGTTKLSIHASLSERVVELRRNGRVWQRLPVTIGAPGTPTPVGRFAVTDVIVGGLNPVYGCCAIALSARQPSLSEDWIGGDRIAIHGSTGAVGSASSNGCLRASDPDVSKLAESVPLGTPVFVTS